MRTIFDNILLELADCAKNRNSIQAQRLECAIIDKYKAGLLSHYEYNALYSVAHTLREEAR
mgnify:FL=1